MKKRTIYFLIFVLLFLTEVLIALFWHDNFIRPYMGDVIVVIVLYFSVRTIFPERMKLLPLWIFLFACIVEIGQYFNYAVLLGFADNLVMLTILGTSFAVEDLICYAVGCVVCGAFEIVKNKKQGA